MAFLRDFRKTRDCKGTGHVRGPHFFHQNHTRMSTYLPPWNNNLSLEYHTSVKSQVFSFTQKPPLWGGFWSILCFVPFLWYSLSRLSALVFPNVRLSFRAYNHCSSCTEFEYTTPTDNLCVKHIGCSIWNIPRPASASRALLRLSPCYWAHLRPP